MSLKYLPEDPTKASSVRELYRTLFDCSGQPPGLVGPSCPAIWLIDCMGLEPRECVPVGRAVKALGDLRTAIGDRSYAVSGVPLPPDMVPIYGIRELEVLIKKTVLSLRRSMGHGPKVLAGMMYVALGILEHCMSAAGTDLSRIEDISVFVRARNRRIDPSHPDVARLLVAFDGKDYYFARRWITDSCDIWAPEDGQAVS